MNSKYWFCTSLIGLLVLLSFTIGKPSSINYSIESSKQFLFVGIPNPIYIAGLDNQDYIAIVENDTFLLTNKTNTLLVNPNQNGFLKVELKRENSKGDYEQIATKSFIARRLPNPKVYLFGGRRVVSYGEAQTCNRLGVAVTNWMINITTAVRSFAVLQRKNEGDTLLMSEEGRFTKEQKDYIKTLKSGDHLILQDIQVQMPKNEIRNIGSSIYRIE